MNDTTIKIALSYSLGADLHEDWRKTRLKNDGSYEPRIKNTKDEEWTKQHGTNTVDIANSTFSEMPSDYVKRIAESILRKRKDLNSYQKIISFIINIYFPKPEEFINNTLK